MHSAIGVRPVQRPQLVRAPQRPEL